MRHLESEYEIIDYLRGDLAEVFNVYFEESTALTIKIDHRIKIERWNTHSYSLIVDGKEVDKYILGSMNSEDIIDEKRLYNFKKRIYAAIDETRAEDSNPTPVEERNVIRVDEIGRTKSKIYVEFPGSLKMFTVEVENDYIIIRDEQNIFINWYHDSGVFCDGMLDAEIFDTSYLEKCPRIEMMRKIKNALRPIECIEIIMGLEYINASSCNFE